MIYRTYNTDDKFYFFKMPTAFIFDEDLKDLSIDARYLFIILVDDTRRSRSMRWIDEEGRFYIKRTTTLIQKDLKCSYKKAIKALDDLESHDLIKRVKSENYSADRIYVSDITKMLKAKEEIQDRKGVYVISDDYKEFNNGEMSIVEKADSVCQKDNLTLSKSNIIQECEKPKYIPEQSINNNLSNSEILEKINEIEMKTDYLTLCELYNDGIIEMIYSVIKNTISSTFKDFLINGSIVEFDKVVTKLMKLEEKHIRYVHECFINIKKKVHNIRPYVLTMLFEAEDTFDAYYQNRLNAEQGI